MRFKAALLYLIALLLILGGTLSSCGALADDKQSNLPPVVVFESETGNALITATVRSAQFFDDWRGEWQGRPYLGTEVTLQLDDTQVLAGDFGIPESLQITVVAKNDEITFWQENAGRPALLIKTASKVEGPVLTSP